MTAPKRAPLKPPLATADDIKRQQLRDWFAAMEADECMIIAQAFMDGVF